MHHYLASLFQIIGIKSIWGKYRAGVLEGLGKVVLMDTCETVLQGNFRDGKLHGFVKGISLKEGILSFIGRFQKGRPVGNCWKGNGRIPKYNTNSYFYWQQVEVIRVYIY